MACSPEQARENGKKGGRPKGYASLGAERMREYIARRIEKDLKPIVDTAIKQSIEGNPQARDWLWERGYGKVRQEIDHTTKGEKLPTPIYGGASLSDTGHDSNPQDIPAQEAD